MPHEETARKKAPHNVQRADTENWDTSLAKKGCGRRAARVPSQDSRFGCQVCSENRKSLKRFVRARLSFGGDAGARGRISRPLSRFVFFPRGRSGVASRSATEGFGRRRPTGKGPAFASGCPSSFLVGERLDGLRWSRQGRAAGLGKRKRTRRGDPAWSHWRESEPLPAADGFLFRSAPRGTGLSPSRVFALSAWGRRVGTRTTPSKGARLGTKRGSLSGYGPTPRAPPVRASRCPAAKAKIKCSPNSSAKVLDSQSKR